MRIETTSGAPTTGAGGAAKTPSRQPPEELGSGSTHRPTHRESQRELSPALRLPETPQHSLSIQIDQHRRVVYQVIDAKTGEVVRQIPPEEVRRAGQQVDELLRRQESQGQHQLDLSS